MRRPITRVTAEREKGSILAMKVLYGIGGMGKKGEKCM